MHKHKVKILFCLGVLCWMLFLFIFLVRLGSLRSSEKGISLSSNCSNNSVSNQQQCWEDLIEKTLENESIDSALALVADLYASESNFSSDCHGFAHLLGESAYLKFISGEEFTPTSFMSLCGYGFYHGFMEKAVQAGGNFEQIYGFCRSLKDKLPMSSGVACFHGIGHGALRFITDRHIDQLIGNAKELAKKSLAICSEISHGADDYYEQCLGGVFMEISDQYVSGENGLVINRNDPMELCHEQDDRDKKHCYGQMYSVLMFIDRSIAGGVKYIQEIPEDIYAQEIMKNFASLVTRLEGGQVDDIKACRGVQERLRDSCLLGLVFAHVLREPPGKEYSKALEFCSSGLLTEVEKNTCFHAILMYSSHSQTRSDHERTCALVADQYKSYCP